MSITTTQGPRPLAAPVPALGQVGNGRATSAQIAPASGRLAAELPTVNPASLRNDIVTLSRQGLQARSIDQLRSAKTDFAPSLVRGVALGLSKADETQRGSISQARFQLTESASFIGTGQITTKDGQSFDIEIEVRYQTEADAQISQYTGSPAPEPGLSLPDALALTGKALPAIEFPGSLSDLFKLLGRELSGAIGKDRDAGGDLSMRLLRLVDRAALLAPRLRQDDPQAPPAERNKALANAYASAPDQIDSITA